MKNFLLVQKIILLLLVLVFVSGITWYSVSGKEFLKVSFREDALEDNLQKKIIPNEEDQNIIFKRFKSDSDLKNYISKGIGSSRVVSFARLSTLETAVSVDSLGNTAPSFSADKASRFSETNVQVLGVDEPDIVKTDGENVFLSSRNYYRNIRPLTNRSGFSVDSEFVNDPSIELSIPDPDRLIVRPALSPEGEVSRSYPSPDFIQSNTNIINAFPPENLSKKAVIDFSGNLLLNDDILIIFSGDKAIYGYDVSNPNTPKEKWSIDLDSNTRLFQARIYDGKIYIVTKNNLNESSPCPIYPYSLNSIKKEVSCENIYYPGVTTAVETIYNVATINPDTGKLSLGVSFIGSYNSNIYMSKEAIYVAYTYSSDMAEFFYGFISENRDIFSNKFIDRVEKLMSYDISQSSKLAEIKILMSEFKRYLDKDDLLKFENDINNKLESYVLKNNRNLVKTNIVKIKRDSFEFDSIGVVAGSLLNQFSMDEYEGNLRVATTIDRANLWGIGLGTVGNSVNDVYVLDDKMEIIGSVLDMGKGERIYSVRFIEDKGYVVTFKQIDPFYVLNLQNPKSPAIEGELKIPGYSSYLHPINKDTILGIGKEGSNVKISLFDVSNPKNPKEISKYTMKEYWSEVLNNSRAFLIDKKNKAFFLPGNRAGYVFSYENNELVLKKAISDIVARRAVYIDDYLYVIGNNSIVVLSELNWEVVNKLNLNEELDTELKL